MDALRYVLEIAQLSLRSAHPLVIGEDSILSVTARTCVDGGILKGRCDDRTVAVEGFTESGLVLLVALGFVQTGLEEGCEFVTTA